MRHSPMTAPAVLSETDNPGDVRVKDQAEPADTPDAFLKALGESLKGKAGVDADLADVLKEHILRSATSQNAVAQAKEAILKLASERAAAKPEPANG